MISSKKRDKEEGFRPKFEPVEPAGTLPGGNCFVNEILHFEECFRKGKEPISSGKDNLETIKMIMGIYESSSLQKAEEATDPGEQALPFPPYSF